MSIIVKINSIIMSWFFATIEGTNEILADVYSTTWFNMEFIGPCAKSASAALAIEEPQDGCIG